MKNVVISVILGCLLALSLAGCRNPATVSAKIYIQQGELDKAVESLKSALAGNPNDAEAHYLLGQVYSHKKMYPEMLKEFESAKSLSNKYNNEIDGTQKKHHRDLYNNAVEMYNQKKYDEALADGQNAALIVPDDQATWALLARVYVKKEQNDDALMAFEKADSLDPKYEFMPDHVLLMQFYYNKGMYEKALNKAMEILKVDPNQKDANRAAAFSYNSLGESQKALEYYQKVLSDQPNDPDLNFNMGQLYKAMQKYDESIASFHRTMEFNPKDVEAILNIAGIYLEVKKDYPNAVVYYQKAVELDPNNAGIWQNLGVALMRDGDQKQDQSLMDEGKKALNKAAELQGKNP
ncbi:MAG: tetratricopeptide repeat protein [bacterium]|nr:tetratricopeptide repeat protein [bacterium]